jgi:hypothetical protein
MRRTMRFVDIAAGALLAGVLAATACADDFPQRRPGLWQVTTQLPVQVPNMEKLGLGDIKMCLDAETDKLFFQSGQNLSKQMCSRVDMKVDGKTVIVESECKILDRTITGRSVTTVNDTAYHSDVTSSSDPPIKGRPNPTRTSQDGYWTGPCPADLHPGDIVTMGGLVKINVKDVVKGVRDLAPMLKGGAER